MALRDIAPWRRRREATSPYEALRSLVEPMEQLIKGFAGPSFELEEKPKELVVSGRVPGFSKQDLTIDVTGDVLTIGGCRTSSRETRRHGALRRSSEESVFTRRMTLPAAVKKSAVTATFKGDRLEIRLPREKEVESRRIGID